MDTVQLQVHVVALDVPDGSETVYGRLSFQAAVSQQKHSHSLRTDFLWVSMHSRKGHMRGYQAQHTKRQQKEDSSALLAQMLLG